MSSTCIVVVADDNRDAADSLVALLRTMGYPAAAAYDGREAVEACSVLEPDLAILDIQMPLLDGCAAARLIRSGAHPPGTIASLSAQRHWDEPMKSEGGAFDVRLAKPARIEQLRELLANAVGRPSDGPRPEVRAPIPEDADGIAAEASADDPAPAGQAGAKPDTVR